MLDLSWPWPLRPRAAQDPHEIREFIDLLVSENIRSYLEVGVYRGGTFDRVMRSLPRGSRGVAADLPGGRWGKAATEKSLTRTCERLRRDGYDVTLILGDSHDLATVERARSLSPFDAILIDADHLYEGVKRDWTNYGPMGRIVAFHDIAGEGHVNGANLEVEVPRLWRELQAASNATREIIAPRSKKGIGVIWR